MLRAFEVIRHNVPALVKQVQLKLEGLEDMTVFIDVAELRAMSHRAKRNITGAAKQGPVIVR